MYYAKIKHYDIANGQGIRESLFLSGCKIYCKNCFNKELWDYEYGTKYTEQTTLDILNDFKDRNLNGFSLLGGEPFCRDKEDIDLLVDLVSRLKTARKDIDFWVWSGYTYDEIAINKYNLPLLKEFDILIDGQFISELYNPKLYFRGSSNQRMIDIKKNSLKK